MKILRLLKIRSVLTIIFFAFCMKTYALGIGPQIEINTGVNFYNDFLMQTGAACSIKLDNEPVVIAVSTDYDIMMNRFDALCTVDYWLVNPPISDYCSFFAGIGAGYGIEAWKTDFTLNSVKRIVFGFNWIYLDGFMEPFIQLAIQQNSFVNANFNTDTTFTFPVSSGIRFYF